MSLKCHLNATQDFEQPLSAGSPEAAGYTALVRELRAALRAEVATDSQGRRKKEDEMVRKTRKRRFVKSTSTAYTVQVLLYQ